MSVRSAALKLIQSRTMRTIDALWLSFGSATCATVSAMLNSGERLPFGVPNRLRKVEPMNYVIYYGFIAAVIVIPIYWWFMRGENGQ